MSNSTDYSGSLLPPGMVDVLPPDAEKITTLEYHLLQDFAAFGYNQVMPPLMEFEHSLLPISATALSEQSFRLMDPVSQKMLAIRADMTGQAARLAMSRLQEFPLPLRLSYAGDIVRVTGDAIQPVRQLRQIGIELIGSDRAAAIAEIIALTSQILQKYGVKDLSIDLTLPHIIHEILRETRLSEQEQERLHHYVVHKDKAAMQEFGDLGQVMNSLIQGGGEAQEVLEQPPAIIAEKFPEDLAVLQNAWKELTGLTDGSIRFLVDWTDYRGYSYHSRFGYSFFTPQSKQEIGRGSAYMTPHVLDRPALPACGVSLFMPELDQIMDLPIIRKHVLVPADLSFPELAVLQESGWTTIRHLMPDQNLEAAARTQGCDAYYDRGEVMSLTTC